MYNVYIIKEARRMDDDQLQDQEDYEDQAEADNAAASRWEEEDY
jgi:hypothetical protein